MLQLVPGGFIKDVEDDDSPVLGGDLDGGGFDISNVGAGTFASLVVDGNTVNLSDVTDEYVLAFDTVTQTWRGVVSAAGVTTFVALTDTPANYTNAAKKVAVVNEAGNAIAFASKLYWDETNGFLGLGILTPTTNLHILISGGIPHANLRSDEVLLLSRLNDPATFAGIIVGDQPWDRVIFKGIRARGTQESPTRALDGDTIFSFIGEPYDGAARRGTAGIDFTIDGPTSSGNMPQNINFRTGETTGRTARLTIKPNGNIGIGTSSPDADALLDVASTTKGFLPPRMTTAQRDAITTPPAGLVVYNTSTNKLNFYNGSAWEAVTSS